ncbi:MAG: ATPase, T2SS/T4P/T4SS family [Myxococcota bacterium]
MARVSFAAVGDEKRPFRGDPSIDALPGGTPGPGGASTPPQFLARSGRPPSGTSDPSPPAVPRPRSSSSLSGGAPAQSPPWNEPTPAQIAEVDDVLAEFAEARRAPIAPPPPPAVARALSGLAPMPPPPMGSPSTAPTSNLNPMPAFSPPSLKPPPPSIDVDVDDDEDARRLNLPAPQLSAWLEGSEYFRGMDPANLARVVPQLPAFEYASGVTIVKAGARVEWVGMLYQGKATATAVNMLTGEPGRAEAVKPGDLFGEAGALIGGAHPMTVVAEGNAVVLRIDAAFFEQLTSKGPGFGQAIARRAVQRLNQQLVLGGGGGGSPKAAVSAPDPSPKAPAGVVPFVETGDYSIGPTVLNALPARLIHSHRALPLALRGKTLTVGMVNPRNTASISDLKRVLSGLEVEVVAIAAEDFSRAVAQFKLDPSDGNKGRAGQAMISADRLRFDVADSEREAERELRVIGDEVVRTVSRIIAAGIEREASDIHIEPEATNVKVRFRVAGSLEDWSELVPLSMARGLVARVKVLSGLDITERRMPLDGRLGLSIGPREIDLRVSTVPTSRGEKVVMRICESAAMLRQLGQVFLEPQTLALARTALAAPSGAIVVGGGTGSGKSSSLYSMLAERRRARPDQATVMVEDPIEYRLSGVTQIQVNTSIGLTFPKILRAMMRQDPDVIVVGETRDPETALIALEASLTGHLLFTSIHGNDALAVLQRFESLGAPRSLMGQALSLVVSQRLVPRLCGTCAKLETPPALLQESLVAQRLLEKGSSVALPKAVGCDACGVSGTAGAVLLSEALAFSEELRAALIAGISLTDLGRSASESKQHISFRQCASFLMSRKMISASDALMAISR